MYDKLIKIEQFAKDTPFIWPKNIKILTIQSLNKLAYIDTFPSDIEELYFSDCKHLTQFVALPYSLKKLKLNRCYSINNFPFMGALDHLTYIEINTSYVRHLNVLIDFAVNHQCQFRFVNAPNTYNRFLAEMKDIHNAKIVWDLIVESENNITIRLLLEKGLAHEIDVGLTNIQYSEETGLCVII
jgi:hypothetical protein